MARRKKSSAAKINESSKQQVETMAARTKGAKDNHVDRKSKKRGLQTSLQV
jgi:hypothetical protein